MPKVNTGDIVEARSLKTIDSTHIEIPSLTQLTHLQFRRYAGCPMCHLHIRSFIHRHHEILDAGIQEVAVFHSSSREMLKHHAKAPFALIADPRKALYAEFGVEASARSVLHPGSWLPALKGMVAKGISLPERGQSALGLPADFLIGREGRVVARKYGTHAYDHWTVNELLELAGQAAAFPPPASRPPHVIDP